MYSEKGRRLGILERDGNRYLERISEIGNIKKRDLIGNISARRGMSETCVTSALASSVSSFSSLVWE